ncbi:MAG: nitroreductase family protein [Lachnospiraceae bacterium]
MVESIFHRTSVRNFLDKEVEEDKIKLILQAAMAAPSAGNQQPWEFYVVKNKEILKALAETSPYAQCASNAPMAFVVCYKTNAAIPSYCEIDTSIATQNMLLAIDDLGLGAVWLGIAPLKDRIEAVNKVIHIKEGLTSFAIVPCGYPDQVYSPKERFDEERIHYIE